MGAADPAAQPIEVRVAKAMSHPLRVRILERLSEGVSSPSDVAEELGERLNLVSYHTRILLEHGCIELVDTKPRRGATEHYYRAIVRPELDEAQWRRLPLGVRRTLVGQRLAGVWEDVSKAGDAGGFDPPDVHISRTLLQLDAQGWEELSSLLVGVIDAALRIQAGSVERRAADGGETRPSELVVLHFARPKAAPKPRRRRA